MRKKSCIILLLFGWLSSLCHGQISTQDLRGFIVNSHNNETIPYASIYCKDMNRGTVSDLNGAFHFSQVKSGRYQLKVSSIGYQSLDTILVFGNSRIHVLDLKPLNMKLKEVLVIAQESKSESTGSVIKRDALFHLQPSSFADILELLPGGMSGSKNLTGMQLITFREAGGSASGDYNSSFGAAFVIDGMPISNDGELQTVSGTFQGDRLQVMQRNTTGKGVDMRMISTDDIESVEVIRGIPSVRYGDLTSGVVNIKRKYYKSPYRLRLKSSPNSKQIALGKGIEIDKSQFLNLNFDYIKYESDLRNEKLNYSRLTSSLRYKKENTLGKSPSVFKANLDYTGSFDKQKLDPEIDYPQTDSYNNDYNRILFSSSVVCYPHQIEFIEQLSLRISGSYTSEQKKINRLVSTGGTLPSPLGDKQGVQDGVYLPASYQSQLKVDGKPVYLNMEFNGDFAFSTFKVLHSVYAGGDWRYNKNFGCGQIFDPYRPPYPQTRIRPRASKSIPSMQKLSFFLEDKFKIPMHGHTLNVLAGIRATSALNLTSKYHMNNRFYYDPRMNISWMFPAINLINRKTIISLHTGMGRHTKVPALTHLYPSLSYLDIKQLNYYSQNEKLSRLNFITYVEDHTNYGLNPAVNDKWELGMGIKFGKVKLSVTYFREKMKSGFNRLSNYNVYKYTDYDELSVSSKDLTGPPNLDQFNSELKRCIIIHSQWMNGGVILKQGLEFDLDMGSVEALLTRISLNGAWFKTEYDQSLPKYRGGGPVLDGKLYPYIGLYDWHQGRTYERFNTNIRFDTQIKHLGLIFSSMIQTLWYSSHKYSPHDGMPDYYIDADKQKHIYKPEDINDPVLRHLYLKPSSNAFDKVRNEIAVDLNLKVTKTIGKNMRFAFYVNSLIDYRPDYRRNNGLLVKRRVSPTFGMELNINL